MALKTRLLMQRIMTLKDLAQTTLIKQRFSDVRLELNQLVTRMEMLIMLFASFLPVI